LKKLKGRSAFLIERDDLTIEDNLSTVKSVRESSSWG